MRSAIVAIILPLSSATSVFAQSDDVISVKLERHCSYRPETETLSVRLRVKGTSTVVSKIGKTTTTPIDRFVALYCVKGACDGHSLAKVDGDYFRSFTLRNLRVTSRGEEKIEIEALRYKYTYNRKANTFEVYVNSDSADGAEIEQLSGKCQ